MKERVEEPLSPMLATLVEEPFSRPGWVHEEKYDGYRALAYADTRGRVRIYSRNRKPLTSSFPEIVAALRHLPGRPFVLDGEIVALDRRGVSRFQLLQRRDLGDPVRPVFAVFDCLELAGEPLLKRPLSERRAALESIVPRGSGQVRLSRRVSRDGTVAYATARRRGWEGVVGKKESSPYQPGARSRDWLKVKVRKESEFVIGGYTPPAGSRDHFGAILVGLYDGKILRFAGKVGTGFSQKVLTDLAGRMRPLRSVRSPFGIPPRERGATWLHPKLVAQIAFGEWTSDGKLRQPVFLGLRKDKKPRECLWSEREV
ncbi:MAG: non-homologous end-joining DNA ligase [Thermoanaerobaculia bacterium]